MERECYNCRYLEFDINLCTQFFCTFHEKLTKQDDTCPDWTEKE